MTRNHITGHPSVVISKELIFPSFTTMIWRASLVPIARALPPRSADMKVAAATSTRGWISGGDGRSGLAGEHLSGPGPAPTSWSTSSSTAPSPSRVLFMSRILFDRDVLCHDQPSRPMESQVGPATGDVDQDALVARLLETIEFMIARLAAEAVRGGVNHPVCEEHDGLDSPECVDNFSDETSGRALDPAGVKAVIQTEIEFIESAEEWQVVSRTSIDFGTRSLRQRNWQ